MFYFSFRGLGYLAPAAMFGPFFLMFLFLQMNPESPTTSWLGFMGAAAVLSPVFAYLVGRWLNRNGIEHLFCEIRFEHWGIIELVVGGLVVLGMALEQVQDLLGFGSWLSQNLLLIYLGAVVVVPVWLFSFIRKHKRLDAELQAA